MRYRAWVTGGVAVVLVAAAAGCSGGQSGQQQNSGSTTSKSASTASPAQVAQAAYSKTTDAKTAKLNTTTTVHAKGRALTVKGHGATNFAMDTGTFTLKLPRGAGDLKMRFLSGKAYEKLPAKAAQQLGSSTPWVSIDVDAVSKKAFGAGLSQLSGGAPQDPSAKLGYLRGISGKSVHKVGSGSVHGVKATHYKADIKWDKAFGDNQKVAQKLEKLTGSDTMPVDLWVDGKGRVVQMKFTETLHPKAVSGSGTSAQSGPIKMDITEALSDYGTPVHVSAPPKDKTTDVTDKVTSQLSGH